MSENKKGRIRTFDYPEPYETPVGLLTPFRDRNGKRLVTGDVVCVIGPDGNVRDRLAFVIRSPGHNAEREDTFLAAVRDGFVALGMISAEAYRSEGVFIGGMSGLCNNYTGEFENGWSVVKVKRYTELLDKETYAGGVYLRPGSEV